MTHFIGVDVGTSSVRAGLFDQRGQHVDSKVEPITVHNPKNDFYEQSSEQIWTAVCSCVKHLTSGHPNIEIASIGFDATCSLVLLDEQWHPVSVSPDNRENDSVNVIMWMDHRAKSEAEFINSLDLECLRTVGGRISPEMDPPKILWLKNHFGESFRRTAHFFSLPDYLVWRASQIEVRSVCTTTCKWLLKSNQAEKSWDKNFWSRIGLEELIKNDFSRIGSRVEKPFSFCPELKISSDFATSTGLKDSVRVGISMIDAHAGGIGAMALTLGFLGPSEALNFDEVLVIVSGTSSCFMASSKEAHFVPGIWGPYFDAMIPGMWLNEAGQSVTGKLIDHLIESHPASDHLYKVSAQNKCSVYHTLELVLKKLTAEKNLPDMIDLTKSLHVYPDFHGNRSPLADPDMSGQVCGLSFDQSIDGVAILYLATIQSLAYQSLHILEKLHENRVRPKMLTIIGGLAQNRLYCQTLSDVCAMPVLVPAAPEITVILGSAILGASNCDEFKGVSFERLIRNFGSSNGSTLITPNSATSKFHGQKFKVFKSMIDDQLKYRRLMEF